MTSPLRVSLAFLLLLCSSTLWAQVSINLMPVTPPNCVSFHANVTIDAVLSDGSLLLLGTVSPDQNLARWQLDQLPVQKATLPSVTAPKIAILVEEINCRSRRGVLFEMPDVFAVLSQPTNFGSTTCVLLNLDMHEVKDAAIVPVVRRLAMPCTDGTPPGSMEGVTWSSSSTSITVIE
jgi:hypothetical protein